jgi:hypothetical protein
MQTPINIVATKDINLTPLDINYTTSSKNVIISALLKSIDTALFSLSGNLCQIFSKIGLAQR